MRTGLWEKVIRGIYRFVSNESELSEYWLWYLWFEDRNRNPQGVFSHETALLIYGLPDLDPEKTHMTVPKKFRKGTDIPKIIFLHKKDANESDTKTINGLRVTTVLRTLIDLIFEQRVSDEFIKMKP